MKHPTRYVNSKSPMPSRHAATGGLANASHPRVKTSGSATDDGQRCDIDAVPPRRDCFHPPLENYLEPDFIMNVAGHGSSTIRPTTTTVERALAHFKKEQWDDVRTLEDLEHRLEQYPQRQGWQHCARSVPLGLQHVDACRAATWTRPPTSPSRTSPDQDSLRAWAQRSTFKRDFEGNVHGLGPACVNWLVMRQVVETVKTGRAMFGDLPRRPSGDALNDDDVVSVVVHAPRQLGYLSYEIDGRSGKKGRRLVP